MISERKDREIKDGVSFLSLISGLGSEVCVIIFLKKEKQISLKWEEGYQDDGEIGVGK